MSELSWGRHFLLCRPEHFDVTYEINPYMSAAVRPDPVRAEAQFENLVHSLTVAGATIEWLDPVEGLPDLVFTANAGVVDGKRFIPSRFNFPERQGETAYDEAWFSSKGFEVTPLPGGRAFEGAGDALPFGGASSTGTGPATLVAGYKTRSSIYSHLELGELLGVPVRSVELVDPRYYHLDLVFCPLDDQRALVAPQGLDAYGCRVIEATVPEPIWLEDEEAEAFCANSVVVGNIIVMPSCTSRLATLIEAAGFEIAVSPVGEFLKAGGGCRCLTLALDTVLGGRGSLVVV